MKVSLSWLSDYIDLPTSDPTELSDIFANLGHEVEGVEILEPQFRDVVIGKVLTVQPHPNADKVRLCSVDTGNGPTDIICGAWNFEAGATVPVAVPGAVLGEDFLITQRDIRGVTSNGMICSAKELGLGEEADGIMVLADDLPIGTRSLITSNYRMSCLISQSPPTGPMPCRWLVWRENSPPISRSPIGSLRLNWATRQGRWIFGLISKTIAVGGSWRVRFAGSK